MKKQKLKGVGFRLNDTQEKTLQHIIQQGLAKTSSGAIQYLIKGK